MDENRSLTALELTALGIILKQGPCIAHEVVLAFSTSQTLAYRSGAGSIYPLLQRLSKAGYLLVSGRQYELTEKGRDALRAWLRPPFTRDEISSNLDQIRSRMYFLRLLSAEEREAFFEATLLGLEALLAECQEAVEHYVKSGDVFSESAMKGAVYETLARIKWLVDVRVSLIIANGGVEG